jgi:3-oxoacyl-[acyl-carrier protein] reductase
MGRLDGKVALITGGAGEFGSATARRFIEEGAKVMLSDLDGAKAAAVASNLGTDCRSMAGDHTKMADNEATVKAVLEAFGHLDILFNNAGLGHAGAIEGETEDVFEKVMAVNVSGPQRMTRAALPALRQRAQQLGDLAGVSIMFTASIQSIMVRPNMTTYGTSKHAIAGFLASLALELAPEHIRVNGVCPGPVDTPLLRSVLEGSPGGTMDEKISRYETGIPLGKLTRAIDVANTLVFLCSDEAQAITGVLLPIDGGQTAR